MPLLLPYGCNPRKSPDPAAPKCLKQKSFRIVVLVVGNRYSFAAALLCLFMECPVAHPAPRLLLRQTPLCCKRPHILTHGFKRNGHPRALSAHKFLIHIGIRPANTVVYMHYKKLKPVFLPQRAQNMQQAHGIRAAGNACYHALSRLKHTMPVHILFYFPEKVICLRFHSFSHVPLHFCTALQRADTIFLFLDSSIIHKPGRMIFILHQASRYGNPFLLSVLTAPQQVRSYHPLADNPRASSPLPV